jgi:hypothetical protein
MTVPQDHPTRRALTAAGLALAAVPSTAAARSRIEPAAGDLHHTGAPGDFDFLVGSWTVRHSRLNGRLVDSDDWQAFDGACTMWKTLGGAGNVDDNALELPAGAYRAMTVRAFDPESRQWSIWWLDQRTGTIDPPVRGGFTDGVGVFFGDDVHNGRPVKVMFRWSRITANAAHWEQAFSPDGGQTWETNWRMQFTRVA